MGTLPTADTSVREKRQPGLSSGIVPSMEAYEGICRRQELGQHCVFGRGEKGDHYVKGPLKLRPWKGEGTPDLGGSKEGGGCKGSLWLVLGLDRLERWG